MTDNAIMWITISIRSNSISFSALRQDIDTSISLFNDVAEGIVGEHIEMIMKPIEWIIVSLNPVDPLNSHSLKEVSDFKQSVTYVMWRYHLDMQHMSLQLTAVGHLSEASHSSVYRHVSQQFHRSALVEETRMKCLTSVGMKRKKGNADIQ